MSVLCPKFVRVMSWKSVLSQISKEGDDCQAADHRVMAGGGSMFQIA